MRLTKETLTKLNGLLVQLRGVQRAEARTSDAIDAIRCECDHKLPDGSNARTYDADGAYCNICKRLV